MLQNQHSRACYLTFNLSLIVALGLTLVVLPSMYYQSAYAQIINPKPLETFTASGLVGSLIFNNTTKEKSNNSNITSIANQNPYILAGNWTMHVTNKRITIFNINFTMVRADGSDRHTHEFLNFKRVSSIPIILDPKGITFIGMMDIKLNGGNKWFGVPITVSIGKLFNTISITPDSKYTDNHFMGQPVRGIFTSLIDQTGTQLMISRSPA